MTVKGDREARLAAQLRANLKRRKAAGRMMQSDESAELHPGEGRAPVAEVPATED